MEAKEKEEREEFIWNLKGGEARFLQRFVRSRSKRSNMRYGMASATMHFPAGYARRAVLYRPRHRAPASLDMPGACVCLGSLPASYPRDSPLDAVP